MSCSPLKCLVLSLKLGQLGLPFRLELLLCLQASGHQHSNSGNKHCEILRTCEISYPHGSTRKRGGHVMRKFPLKVRPTAVGVTFTNSSLTA